MAGMRDDCPEVTESGAGTVLGAPLTGADTQHLDPLRHAARSVTDSRMEALGSSPPAEGTFERVCAYNPPRRRDLDEGMVPRKERAADAEGA